MKSLDICKYPIPNKKRINPKRIVFVSDKYLILDGIDVKGNETEEPIFNIYYTDGENYLNFGLDRELWRDKPFFWGWTRGVVRAMKKGL